MCIEGKTQSLAKKLKKDILDKIDSPDQAREMIQENKLIANSQIARMAELYYENQEKFGIVREVAQVRSHPVTKLSAIRGAITAVLQGYIDERQRITDKAIFRSNAFATARA
jgi:tRNA isopentenyl-2-thiomethyl-A-37 hydroxylase MiaE